MAKRNKEPRFFLEVDIDVLTKWPEYSVWVLIAEGAGKTEKILTEKMQAEVMLLNPDIDFCLVANYLTGRSKEDKNKEVKVLFGGIVHGIPLYMIKRVVVRP